MKRSKRLSEERRKETLPITEPFPSLDQMQQWTRSLGQAQQLLLEYATEHMMKAAAQPVQGHAAPPLPDFASAGRMAQVQADFAKESMDLWQRFLDGGRTAAPPESPAARADRRFADPKWAEHPFFDMIRQSYLLVADYLTRLSDTVDGVDPHHKEKIRFATQGLVDALSPG
ncbi:MAG: hypothetical protein B7Z20_06575, partial [Sphingobium sp. 32-64-5]